MNTRLSNENDFIEIYLMGFDIWSEGSSRDDYLRRCESSSKYAKGTWYVL